MNERNMVTNTTRATGARMPVFFLSHGGGPWPYIDGMRELYATTEREFKNLPAHLPGPPKAVLVITGHWEAAQFTVSTAEHPPMEYDYSGFPPHTYQKNIPRQVRLNSHRKWLRF